MSRRKRRSDDESTRSKSSSSPNTRRLFPRIAVAFDFDDTLAPDSMGSLLETYGVDKEAYWAEHVHPRVEDGWDPIPAAFYALIEFSRGQKDPSRRLTRDRLVRHGRELKFFPGVKSCLNKLQRIAGRMDIELEFHVISSGIGDVIRGTELAPTFRNIWASDFHYDRTGEISYIRKVISHTEKTRYLQNIARGIGDTHGFDEPLDLNPAVAAEGVRVPLRQIVYVGDGHTDVPCFAMINREKGFTFGIYRTETAQKWGEETNLERGRRLSNLVPADFRAGSELVDSLALAVESIGKSIQLRRRATGE